MKQNKFVQFIAILVSALVQIGMFLFFIMVVRISDDTSFDVSTLPTILQSYGLVTIVILTIGGIIYGGYYVKKHKQSWVVFLRNNVFEPASISFMIGCGIQAINIIILLITLILNLESETLRTQISHLFIASMITGLLTFLFCMIVEECDDDTKEGDEH